MMYTSWVCVFMQRVFVITHNTDFSYIYLVCNTCNQTSLALCCWRPLKHHRCICDELISTHTLTAIRRLCWKISKYPHKRHYILVCRLCVFLARPSWLLSAAPRGAGPVSCVFLFHALRYRIPPPPPACSSRLTHSVFCYYSPTTSLFTTSVCLIILFSPHCLVLSSIFLSHPALVDTPLKMTRTRRAFFQLKVWTLKHCCPLQTNCQLKIASFGFSGVLFAGKSLKSLVILLRLCRISLRSCFRCSLMVRVCARLSLPGQRRTFSQLSHKRVNPFLRGSLGLQGVFVSESCGIFFPLPRSECKRDYVPPLLQISVPCFFWGGGGFPLSIRTVSRSFILSGAISQPAAKLHLAPRLPSPRDSQYILGRGCHGVWSGSFYSTRQTSLLSFFFFFNIFPQNAVRQCGSCCFFWRVGVIFQLKPSHLNKSAYGLFLWWLWGILLGDKQLNTCSSYEGEI